MAHSLRFPFVVALCGLAAGLVAFDARAAGVSPLAATADQKKDATDHFASGRQALQDGDLPRAIAELHASLDVVDSPNAHLELARALRDAGRFDEAWTEYGRAQDTAKRLAAKEERYAKTAEAATAERADVEKKLAFVAVTVSNAPADATLKVAGRLLSSSDWASAVAVPPGAIEIVLVDSRGAEIARTSTAAAVGQTATVSLDARPSASVPAKAAPAGGEDDDRADSSADVAPPPVTVAPLPAPGPGKLRTVAYVAGGAGVAGLLTFAVFGLLSNSAYEDLKATCARGCPPERKSEIDTGVAEQTIANVGLGIGLAGVAAGTTMFLLSMPHPAASPAAAASLVVAPGYLGVRGAL